MLLCDKFPPQNPDLIEADMIVKTNENFYWQRLGHQQVGNLRARLIFGIRQSARHGDRPGFAIVARHNDT